jgi:hypothetical protein
MDAPESRLSPTPFIEQKKNAFSQIRTDDLLITSEVPYQLGHKGNEISPGGESNARSQDNFEVNPITVSRLSQLGHRE